MKCPRCGKENPAEVHTCTPPLALRLADELEAEFPLMVDTAAELRRLHAENESLKQALHMEEAISFRRQLQEVHAENEALREFAEEVRRTGDTRLASMAIAALARAGEVK